MSRIDRKKVTVTTIADGSATAYTDWCEGLLQQIAYVKNNFDNGVDFTITEEVTGVNLWTESNVDATATRQTRGPTHSQAGAAALYAAAGTAVNDRIPVLGRIKIVIAAGGNVKSGDFYFDLA